MFYSYNVTYTESIAWTSRRVGTSKAEFRDIFGELDEDLFAAFSFCADGTEMQGRGEVDEGGGGEEGGWIGDGSPQ